MTIRTTPAAAALGWLDPFSECTSSTTAATTASSPTSAPARPHRERLPWRRRLMRLRQLLQRARLVQRARLQRLGATAFALRAVALAVVGCAFAPVRWSVAPCHGQDPNEIAPRASLRAGAPPRASPR